MNIYSYTRDLIKTFPYPFLPRRWQLIIQRRNLAGILKYAKENSEYYKEIIPDDLEFNKITPINKIQFIENFDKIVTDKEVKLESVIREIKNEDSDGARIANKYSVTMTSGSTGNPTIIVQDESFQNITSITGFFRIFKGRFPMIMIGESGEYGIESSTIKRNMKKFALVKYLVKQIDAGDPIDEIIKQLQAIGPGYIVGYTGVMTVISNELIKKGIRLKEKTIFLTAEYCSDMDRAAIGQAFDCPRIQSLYACTEAGDIAYECKCGRLHLLSDCVKVEPVDINNNPVGYGVCSDKLLLTNFMNKVQPIIRYEVTDRIVLHEAGSCECGNKEEWLEIEGRTNDNLEFERDGTVVQVPSISLLIAMADINKNGLCKFRNYQIFVSRKGCLKVVLDYFSEADVNDVNNEIVERLDRFFAAYNLPDIQYEFEEGIPKKISRGKYKRIVMV